MIGFFVWMLFKHSSNFVSMQVYIFGNGNISFDDFKKHYEESINRILESDNNAEFLLCDFRGTDTLAMELLKSKTSNVTVFHVGEKPRYFPDKFKTKTSEWKIIGRFESDEQRDAEVAKLCTHFLAKDFNSDEKRKSGTLKSIEYCLELGKIDLSI